MTNIKLCSYINLSPLFLLPLPGPPKLPSKRGLISGYAGRGIQQEVKQQLASYYSNSEFISGLGPAPDLALDPANSANVIRQIGRKVGVLVYHVGIQVGRRASAHVGG